MTCDRCNNLTTSLTTVRGKLPLVCPRCHNELTESRSMGSAPSVHGDECDVLIHHGVCNEDGTPKRYRSKSEIKQAAYEKGLFQGGDTPKVNPRIAEANARRSEQG